ncbi:MAG TPA: CHAT domain-containing protein [Steroidobacteraceae bacterium]|nr:CHAT domain-containing protein [Steroidobacteraceae bacterium]
MLTPQQPAELLSSVVPGERRGRPGAARAAALAAADEWPEARNAFRMIAVYGSLAAGEPREALRLLDGIEQADESVARRIAACRPWAQTWERNWYPGDIGGEVPPNYRPDVFESNRVRQGDPETVLIEACAALGPGTVLTARTVVDNLRMRTAQGADSIATASIKTLMSFAEIASGLGAVTPALWGKAAATDVLRRAGHLAEARAALAEIRNAHAALQDAVGVATTWLLEGDWFATPGSSPDSLGLRLEDESPPSFAAERDDAAAAEACGYAQQALQGVDAPRLRGALALRLALLASRAGDGATQASELTTARECFAEAGDAAGEHLAIVHGWIAALDRGDLAAMRAIAPLEWGELHGPVKQMADWAATRGSPSYCSGLGRLLHRCGQRWVANGEYERAEISFRLARGLITLNGAVPAWTIPEALAQLDDRRGFQTRSVVRRLQILGQLPPPPAPSADGYGWLQDLYLTANMINVPTGVTGAGVMAIQLIERGEERLRQLLKLANPNAATEPPAVIDTRAALQTMQTAEPPDVSAWLAEMASGKTTDTERQLLDLGATLTQQTLERARPLAALVKARLNDRMGWDAEADLWFDATARYSRAGTREVHWIEVLALNAWGKRAEALAAYREVIKDPALQESALASLALRAGDFAHARKLFASMPLPGNGPRGSSWRDFTDRAEAELEGGDPAAALSHAMHGIEDLEAAMAGLTRHSDRLEVSDDISVAGLYQYASRARLALAAAADSRGDAAAAEEQRREALALADRHRSLALPMEISMQADATRDPLTLRWRQASTEHVTAFQRLLAALMARSEQVQAATEALGRAERELAAIEAELDASQRPVHASVASKFRAADLQAQLPPQAVLLEYQIVGRDLVAFAVTATRVYAQFTRLPRGIEGRVNRLLRACAAGGAAPQEETELAAILLDPFAAVLRAANRVIVVPSGGLSALPFHLLPLDGKALGAARVVSYLPAALLLARGGLDRPLAAGASLVIGDPEFDAASHPGLRRLAGAAVEARKVAELHATDAVFEAANAREDDLKPKLSGRALLHFAAHGRLDDVAPYTSSIVLAGRDELTVSDFIGLQIDADLAVLSACDTGRGTTTLGGDVIGLTRGLLAAGVKRCVVSLWPVDDVGACVTMVAFHSSLKGGKPPAEALALAQDEVRNLSGAQIAARYRAMGGELGAGERSRRRGASTPVRQLAAFPETDDEDPVAVEDSDGSSARLWAPFILIGC